jgi:hypothetical protein
LKELPIEFKEKKYADVVKDKSGKKWYLLSISDGNAQVISEDYEERETLKSGEYIELPPKGNRVHFHDIGLPDHNYNVTIR